MVLPVNASVDAGMTNTPKTTYVANTCAFDYMLDRDFK